MSTNSQLTTFLKNSGYSNEVIRKIVAAADAAESERLDSLRAFANREGMYELPSPMAAAASDPKKAAIIRQTAGMIKNASGCKYELPLDRSVNEYELRRAISGASLSTRMAIVENLYACGCIRP